MKRTIFYALAASISILMVRCKDPLEKIELSERKVVTRCFISPQDTLLIAFVNWAKPYDLSQSINGIFSGYAIQDTVNQIKNATVIISNQNHSVQLTYKELNYDATGDEEGYNVIPGGYYSIKASQFPIVPGETYFLTVTLPDKTTANASCTVPSESPIIDFQYHYINHDPKDPPELQLGRCYYEIKWKDFIGVGDYYRVAFNYFYMYKGGRKYYRPLIDVTLDNTLLNDIITDGGNYDFQNSFLVEVEQKYATNYFQTISALVLHVDKHYYRYHRSIADQVKAQSNPFYEPILIYTNFDGGLGVFAACNRTQVTRTFVY